LDARCQGEFCFNLALTLFQQRVGLPKLLLHTFLCADIGQDDKAVLLSARAWNLSDTIDDRDLLSVLARKIKLVAMVPIALGCCILLHDVREILLREKAGRRAAIHLATLVSA
jgi:hypothetical protein